MLLCSITQASHNNIIMASGIALQQSLYEKNTSDLIHIFFCFTWAHWWVEIFGELGIDNECYPHDQSLYRDNRRNEQVSAIVMMWNSIRPDFSRYKTTYSRKSVADEATKLCACICMTFTKVGKLRVWHCHCRHWHLAKIDTHEHTCIQRNTRLSRVPTKHTHNTHTNTSAAQTNIIKLENSMQTNIILLSIRWVFFNWFFSCLGCLLHFDERQHRKKIYTTNAKFVEQTQKRSIGVVEAKA